jgi:hypothetical protein
VNRELTSWNKLVLIALVTFVYTFVLNPIATDGCVSPRIFLNSTFVPRRNMSETPQTTTGDPPITDIGNHRGRHNNRNSQRRHHDEEVPTVLRSYRYDINNTNPGETFNRITQEVAQYIATEVPGAGYMRRALIGLEEPRLLPPPKPKPPEEPDDPDDEEEWATHEIERAQHDADLEVWKEEIKLVARRRMEQQINILPSVYAVVWRQCTPDMQELLRSTDVFQAIDESNDVIALLKLIRSSTVMDQRSQHPALNALQAINNFTSFRQMNMSNDTYLEGFRDRLNLCEEVTGQMLGCDTKRVEAQ